MTMINIKNEAGSNPVFNNINVRGDFNGNLNIGQQPKDASRKEPQQPDKEPQQNSKAPQQPGKEPQQKPSDLKAVTAQPELRAVLMKFATLCHGRNSYKWGYAYQALVRKKLVSPDLTKKEFGKIVHDMTGVSATTVRLDKTYLERDARSQRIIEELCAVIDNMTSPLE